MSQPVEIQGIEERIKKFGEAATSNPMMQKRITEIIRQMLAKVRNSLQGQARGGLGMQSDPRKTYKAVRMAVYRKIYGGQVNILQSRKAGATRLYAPPSKRVSNIGGNRRARSQRTTDIMSYSGKDRGFILRFLNQGTNDRKIRFKTDSSREHINRGARGGNTSLYGQTTNTGSRGHIVGRDWFGNASLKELENAANIIDQMLNDLITGVLY